MNRYLLESPHTAEECDLAITSLLGAGAWTHMDWGCKAGVHCGWAVLEAECEDDILLTLPLLVRRKARVVQLNRFTPEDIATPHPH